MEGTAELAEATLPADSGNGHRRQKMMPAHSSSHLPPTLGCPPVRLSASQKKKCNRIEGVKVNSVA